MIIEEHDNAYECITTLSNIHAGDAFKYKEDFFIRTCIYESNNFIRCLRIADGMTLILDDDDLVYKPKDAKVVITTCI